MLIFSIKYTFKIIVHQYNSFLSIFLLLLFSNFLLFICLLASFFFSHSEGNKYVIMLFLNADNNSLFLINEFRMTILLIAISINDSNWEIIFIAEGFHLVEGKTSLLFWGDLCNITQSLEDIKTAIVGLSVYILNSASSNSLNRVLLSVTVVRYIRFLLNI